MRLSAAARTGDLPTSSESSPEFISDARRAAAGVTHAHQPVSNLALCPACEQQLMECDAIDERVSCSGCGFGVYADQWVHIQKVSTEVAGLREKVAKLEILVGQHQISELALIEHNGRADDRIAELEAAQAESVWPAGLPEPSYRNDESPLCWQREDKSIFYIDHTYTHPLDGKITTYRVIEDWSLTASGTRFGSSSGQIWEGDSLAAALRAVRSHLLGEQEEGASE